jgi:hypothetical protein
MREGLAKEGAAGVAALALLNVYAGQEERLRSSLPLG